jgi:hypothetical protein
MLAEQTGNGDDSVVNAIPEYPSEAREYYRRLGKLKGGFAKMAHATRVALGKAYAEQNWKLRRARFGPTGSPQKPHTQWCIEHGYSLPSEREKQNSGD